MLELIGSGLPLLEGENAGVAQVVHMQKFAQGRARAPAGHAGLASCLGCVEAANQAWQHMAIGGVVVIARAIEIGGHQADRIEAHLLAQGAAKFDAGDLGDRIPLVGGLQGTGE